MVSSMGAATGEHREGIEIITEELVKENIVAERGVVKLLKYCCRWKGRKE